MLSVPSVWRSLSIIVASASLFQTNAEIVYVSKSGDGTDGRSWGSAFHTVGEGLVASASGDEIWVAEGVYRETIQLRSFVALYGGFSAIESEDEFETRDWIRFLTVLDGSGKVGSVVTGAEGAILDGFTITKGVHIYGGGIHCANASPLFRHCAIVANRSRFGYDYSGCYNLGCFPRRYGGVGAGVYLENSDSVFIDCAIADNRPDPIDGDAPSPGGGVYILNGSPVFESCGIEGNQGIGIAAKNATPTYVNCAISHQTGAAGLQFELASPYVESCTISANEGSGLAGTVVGGAIVNSLVDRNLDSAARLVGDCRFLSCTVVANRSSDGFGGIQTSQGELHIDNTLIWNYGGEIDAETPVARYSCVQGGFPGTGVIEAWPKFRDIEENDWRLEDGSPCIGAGSHELASQAVLEDLDGNPRLRDASLDIGAYESPSGFVGGATGIQPLRFHVRAEASAGGDGLSWESAFPEVSPALFPSERGYEVWIGSGTYSESFSLESGVAIRGGFQGNEEELEERDPSAGETVFDGAGTSGPVFAAHSIADSTLERIRLVGSKSNETAFWIENSSARIRQIEFKGRMGDTVPVVLSALESSMEIRGCTFEGIDASQILKFEAGAANLSDCRFEKNKASSIRAVDSTLTLAETRIEASAGVPVYLDSCTSEWNRCSISRNLGNDSNLVLLGSKTRLVDCAIVGNRTGGVRINNSALSPQTTLINCLIAENRSTGPAGGLVVSGGGSTRLSNCTLVANRCEDGAGGIRAMGITPVEISNSIVWNYGPEILASSFVCSHSTVQGGLPGVGNLSGWPQFESVAEGDWSLRNGSPCIDRGDDNLVDPGAGLDLIGVPRVQGESVDMGAYESPGDYSPGDPVEPPQRVHVTEAGTGDGSGRDWENSTAGFQEALLRGMAGAEFWIAAGHYPTAVNLESDMALYGGFQGTESSLDQRELSAVKTILDATGTGSRVVTAVGIENATLDGLWITGGAPQSGNGGGVWISGSTATMSRCWITNNRSGPTSSGGGLATRLANLVVRDCTFAHNSSTQGGGLYLLSGDQLFERCLITNNTGGGVYLRGNKATLRHCAIEENTNESRGGGIFVARDVESVIEYCAIRSNRSQVSGGAVYFDWAENQELVGCLVADNFAFGNTGGIVGTELTLINCTVAWNASAGGIGGIAVYGATVTNTILWNDGDELDPNRRFIATSCIQGEVEEVGSFSANPLFVDPARGDWRLAEGSPCIDRGTSSVLTRVGPVDLDGGFRVEGESIDIGAFEAPGIYGRVEIASPVSHFFVKEGNPGIAGTSWGDAFSSVRQAVLASHIPSEIWVTEGLYPDNLHFDRTLRLYGGFSGDEESLGDRETDFTRSAIDGSGRLGSVLNFLRAPDCVVDGFRIEGGIAENGGGIRCDWTGLLVENCEITGNRSESGGDGIYLRRSALEVARSHIHHNTDENGSAILCRDGGLTLYSSIVNRHRGIGIAAGNSRLYLSDAIISDNFRGLSFFNCPQVLIDRCFIANNGGGNLGSGIYSNSSHIQVDNTVLWNNSDSESGGGGIYASDDAETFFLQCALFGNFPYHVFHHSQTNIEPSHTSISNSILWDAPVGNFNGSGVEVTYSNVEGGRQGEGNIDADPRFMDAPHGNFRLLADSPCIDSASTFGPDYDIERRPRPIDVPGRGREGDANEFDMGASERPALGYPEIVLDRDFNYRVDAVDLLYSISESPSLEQKSEIPYPFLYSLYWHSYFPSPMPILAHIRLKVLTKEPAF